MPVRRLTACLLAGVLLGGCSSAPDRLESPRATPREPPSGTSPTTAAPTHSPTSSPSPARPARFDTDRALDHVRVLAGRIGPRLATGRAYREAAAYVRARFEAAGYDV